MLVPGWRSVCSDDNAILDTAPWAHCSPVFNGYYSVYYSVLNELVWTQMVLFGNLCGLYADDAVMMSVSWLSSLLFKMRESIQTVRDQLGHFRMIRVSESKQLIRWQMYSIVLVCGWDVLSSCIAFPVVEVLSPAQVMLTPWKHSLEGRRDWSRNFFFC